MTRTDVLNVLVARYGHRRYLEIGVRSGVNLREVRCPYKVGVDPDRKARGVTHRMTSDEFFQQNTEMFDLVFIDGLHVEGQVTRDIANALDVLGEGGTIVMHDCNPRDEWHQRPASKYKPPSRWNGTAWRSYVSLRVRDDLEMCVVDCDEGNGVIRRGAQVPIDLPADFAYSDFAANRQEWLNLLPPGKWAKAMAREN